MIHERFSLSVQQRGEGQGRGAHFAWLLLLSSCATTVLGTYPGDRVMWDDIHNHADQIALTEAPVAVVLPHHLIDGNELAGFWTALARNTPPVVVVVAPDHYANGTGVTVAQNVTYDTVYGPLRTDPALAKSLPGGRRDSAFIGEHSVHVHAPFIRRALPNVRFVPVILQWGAPRADLEALALQLHQTLPPDALVVASVDFSHYQPSPWATFHDESAYSTVTAFDLDALFLREVDSPESLYVAMRFAQLRGAAKATRVLHTNSQRRRRVLITDSTSHQYFTFTKGEPEPAPSASVLITGDVAASTGLSFHEGWTWHPTRDIGAPKHEGLKHIRGQEDRFFMGPELTLFSLAPGQEVRRRINGLDVLLTSIDPSKPIPELHGDCVIALVPGADPSVLLGKGAHVAVGRGRGPSVPVEQLEAGRVLARSLGPFLGSGDGAAQALGVTCTKSGVRARTVPLQVTDGLPALDLDRLSDELGVPRQPHK